MARGQGVPAYSGAYSNYVASPLSNWASVPFGPNFDHLAVLVDSVTEKIDLSVYH